MSAAMPPSRAIEHDLQQRKPTAPTSPAPSAPVSLSADRAALLERIREGQIGRAALISTPFGQRPLVYADYTASGRALGFLEDNIRNLVLPYYANTHTEASFTGAQTNALRESARSAVRRSVNGGAGDKVIFCGSGATTAINRLIDILGLRLPSALDQRLALSHRIGEAERPVVFVGPYEHHSNELPWRETIAEVVRIGLDSRGQISKQELSDALISYRHKPLKIGSFSAASNVTGVRSDVAGITRMLKAADALSFWDYAAAGPYVAIDMNPTDAPIDAIFLSPHKFVGGPGTPGVLVAKEHLFNNTVPSVVGGGTVSYVSPTEHRYLRDIEHREEGGTPAIVESIRAGAVFALKDQLGAETIEAIERTLVSRALEFFAGIPEIEVLGPTNANRLGIFSLRIRHGGMDLHHGFVAALLNDLFGIQARGGCSCAGPYGHELLGIDPEQSREIDSAVTAGFESFKPGWVRVNFHYAAHPNEIEYMLEAIRLVAELGWRLLPAYKLDHATGNWIHRSALRQLSVGLGDLLDTPQVVESTEGSAATLSDILSVAAETLAKGAADDHRQAAAAEVPLPDTVEGHRWFFIPAEAACQLAN